MKCSMRFFVYPVIITTASYQQESSLTSSCMTTGKIVTLLHNLLHGAPRQQKRTWLWSCAIFFGSFVQYFPAQMKYDNKKWTLQLIILSPAFLRWIEFLGNLKSYENSNFLSGNGKISFILQVIEPEQWEVQEVLCATNEDLFKYV